MSQRQTNELKAADADRIGFFGKLPTLGDFVSTGIGLTLQRALDDWLQPGLRATEERLGSQWREAFHAMRPWRFIVERGLWGPATIAGVLLPSRDRVGRSFPLVITAQLHAFDDHPRQLYLDKAWFTAAEALAETSLSRDFDINAFTSTLQRLRLPHAERSALSGRFAAFKQEAGSLWWTADTTSRQVEGFRTASAPVAADFLRLFEFNQTYQQQQRAGPAETDHDVPIASAAPAPAISVDARPSGPAQARPAFKVRHSHATHPGTRLSLNADALIVTNAVRLFAVADGIGDGPTAVEAARLTAAVLAEVGEHDAIEETISDIKGKLGRAHSLLQSTASSGQREPSAASIVLLSIKHDAFAAVWAGDARCYLVRDGLMRCLTRDHVEVGMKRRLTRHLGAERQLVPEILTDRLEDGDRFLLCSGSLTRVLTERAIAELLLDAELERAAEALVQDGLIANVRDNLSAIVIDASLP